jgi:hypothetical protein
VQSTASRMMFFDVASMTVRQPVTVGGSLPRGIAMALDPPGF